eukprot:TRINITY_DN4401_c0_g1_i1.p1 TRINITY_DN4401_c0_g1~~TRINITY_DN4401_c0_g1_i1.p1  ORF type:complete len:507 (-),score=114.76 TRINITY_DN4401_c0_g1_i1:38-1558(-)
MEDSEKETLSNSQDDKDVSQKLRELELKLKEEENYRVQVEESEANLMEEVKALRLLLEHETEEKDALLTENTELHKLNDHLKSDMDKLQFQLNHYKKQMIQRVENTLGTSGPEPTTPRDRPITPRSSSVDGLLRHSPGPDSLAASNSEVESLKAALAEEVQKSEKLQTERDALFSELEDLSRSLFEESNRLVSDEARKCADLTNVNHKLELELQDAKRRLELESEVSGVLKSKLQAIHNGGQSPTVKSSPRRINRGATQESLLLFESEFETQIAESPPTSTELVLQSPSGRRSNSLTKTSELPAPRSRGSSLTDLDASGADPNKLILFLPEEIHSGDLKDFEEFVAIKPGSVTGSGYSRILLGAFGERVYMHDLEPCLSFKNSKERKDNKKRPHKIKFRDLDSALIDNRCFIEPISEASTQVCCLCLRDCPCKFRMYLESASGTSAAPKQWKFLCNYCRSRVVTVADFYTFVRNVRLGIYKTPITNMYKECLRLRIRMNVARVVSA